MRASHANGGVHEIFEHPESGRGVGGAMPNHRHARVDWIVTILGERKNGHNDPVCEVVIFGGYLHGGLRTGNGLALLSLSSNAQDARNRTGSAIRELRTKASREPH